jgi:hypothetical protein
MAAANEPSAGTPGPQSSASPSTAASGPETAIRAETPPVAAEERIQLPPRPAAPVKRATLSPERLATEIGKLDRVIAGLLLALAFFLGSFAVQNSDFWMHLATGRLLLQGDYRFGEDPHSFHQGDEYWAHHSWLFDGAMYGLASLAGGIDSPVAQAVLVVCKALVAVALAWVLLSVRRPGQSLWVPALCTALAMLALSPRLLLNPISVSLLFLGLTVYLLLKAGRGPHPGREGGGVWAFFAAKPVWLLPPLFALWVNLDGWFILGPLAVGLFLIGELLQHAFAPIRTGPDLPRPDRRATLALVFGAGLLTCLISPFHYHTFTLPTELSYLAAQGSDWAEDQFGFALPLPDQFVAAGRTLQALLATDPLGSFSTYDSPLRGEYFVPAQGLNVAGLAYLVLLTAGFVSFVLAAAGTGLWRWGRFVLWLGFALLSMMQMRLIAFLAVVGGAVTALNVQDLVAARFGTAVRVDGHWKVWSLGGRLATVVAGVFLLLLDWPGWLHSRPDEPRYTHRIAWHVAADPVRQRTAQQLHTAFGDREKHGFNFDPELGAYCAWYCPGDKLFIDTRLGLFAGRIRDYDKLRKVLADPRKASGWEKDFRKWHIDHVIVQGVGTGNVFSRLALQRFWINPRRWMQPGVGDISLIAGWRDRAGGPFAVGPLDMDALAFDAGTDYRAPAEGVDFEPEERGLLAAFRESPAPTPWGAEAAELYISRFDVNSSAWLVVHQDWLVSYIWGTRFSAWSATAAAGGLCAGVGPAVSAATFSSLPGQWLMFSEHKLLRLDDLVPKSPAVLAVRAARRAVAANPHDAFAHLRLAQAYLRLWGMQEDTLGGVRKFGPLPLQGVQQDFRQMLRVVQVVTALQRAVALRPSLRDAHAALFSLYDRLHYWDLALEQLEDLVRLRRAQPQPRRATGESEREFKQRQKSQRDELKDLDNRLKRFRARMNERYKTYKLDAADKRLREKLELTLRVPYKSENENDPLGRGLAKEALDLLLRAKAREMDPAFAIMQLHLLLTTGRTKEVRERLPDLDRFAKELARKTKENPQNAAAAAFITGQVLRYQVMLAAAAGDYAGADRHLAELRDFSSKAGQDRRRLARDFLHGFGFFMTQEKQPFARLALMLSGAQQAIASSRALLIAALRQPAELNLLAGILALEEGDVPRAAGAFRRCLRDSRDLVYFGFTDRVIAETYLREIEKQNK